MEARPLMTNNPRLLEAKEYLLTKSSEDFINKYLIPYVSIEHAQGISPLFCDTFYVPPIKGDIPCAVPEDKFVMRTYLNWVSIARLMLYCLECCRSNRYGTDIKIQFCFSMTNLIKKKWHVDYNKNLGLINFSTNTTYWDDGTSANLRRAYRIAYDYALTMLRRLKEISSRDALSKMADNIVIPTTF